jgi:hypothetical protein
VTRADGTLAGSPRQAPPSAGRPPVRRRRAGQAAGLAAAGVVAFLCYLRLSGTVPVNADGASNALQAWGMLHGNVLLRGWRLSDVSFYTTELPQYMLVEAVRGLGPEVVHVAAAMTYTLLVLLAGLLAKGRATGREAVLRVCIAAGIMLAPQLGSATYTLLLSPDHVGTGVPLLLLWLIIDRAQPRWYVPVTAGVLLAWVQVADSLTLIIGVAPVVIVCTARACQRRDRNDQAALPRSSSGRPGSRASRWYYLSLAGAATASVPAAALAVRLINGLGGYSAYSPRTSLSPAGSLPRHAALAFQGVLELFGAGFAGQRPGLPVFFAAAHLAGLALAVLALGLATVRFFRWEDLVVPALATAIILNLAAYIVSVTPVNIRSTREIASVLPFGAVLAGRLLAGPMLQAAERLRRADRLARTNQPAPAGQLARAGRPTRAGRLVTLALASAAAAGALCYAAALGYDAAQPPVAANDQALAGWLAGHHLNAGLAKYWHANNTTLDSGGRVQLITVAVRAGRPVFGDARETDLSRRDPRSHYANFVVTVGRPAGQARLMSQALLTTLGPPARTYRFEDYTVRVWDRNLLSVLGHG